MSHELSITVSEIERCRLEALVSSRNVDRKHIRRAEVVLHSADGATIREIRFRTGRSKTFILRWHERFIECGLEGLLRNKRRFDRSQCLRAENAQRGKALMLVSSMVEVPPWNQGARGAVLSELMRIDDQLLELSKRLDSLEDRSSVRQLSFYGRTNGSSVVARRSFSEDEENGFAAHVAFGMSKSRMNS
jgi:hypothetical protein